MLFSEPNGTDRCIERARIAVELMHAGENSSGACLGGTVSTPPDEIPCLASAGRMNAAIKNVDHGATKKHLDEAIEGLAAILPLGSRQGIVMAGERESVEDTKREESTRSCH